jgi:putative ABC transport system substrate-binding protein
MRRRDFIRVMGSIPAVSWPFVVQAQQPRKLPRIGFLGASTPAALNPSLTAFVQRLRGLGWIEGRTVAIEIRWGEGRRDRFDAIAAEFVTSKVDVIVTGGTPSIAAAMKATSTIPIVFGGAADPVGTGFVKSLARPGGNVTGLSTQHDDLVGKRLELLRDTVPALRRLGILVNAGNPASMLEMREAQATGRKLALGVTTVEIQRAEDFAPAFQTLKDQADALYVCSDSLMNSNRTRLSTLALTARLPTMHGWREHVEAGAFMSYGPNYTDLHRRAGDYVDKILRGAKPADLPVEQPTRFDLVINLTTAKALGLRIPAAFLLRADEVIE